VCAYMCVCVCVCVCVCPCTRVSGIETRASPTLDKWATFPDPTFQFFKWAKCLDKLGVVAITWKSNDSGGWSGRITWVQEFENSLVLVFETLSQKKYIYIYMWTNTWIMWIYKWLTSTGKDHEWVNQIRDD
jgi:hypothetical protein